MNSAQTAGTVTSGDSQSGHGPGWRAALMLLCCLIPVAAIVAVAAFGLPINSLVSLGLVLLCPVMMLLMMRGHAH